MSHARSILGVTLLVVALAACGSSSSDDDGGSSGDCPAPAYLNLTGIWNVELVSAGSCQSELQRFQVHIAQNGDVLEFRGTTTFTAFMCGSRASIQQPFSYVVNSGVQTVNSLTISFTSSTSFSGTSAWDWVPLSGAGGCSGTSTFTGIR
jgi:hypothetical protein